MSPARATALKVAGPDPSDLRERVRSVLGSGLSQRRAAAEIGISDAALSQWLAGKYRGDGAAVAASVERWLAARTEREALDELLPARPEWVETPTARRVLAGLTYAQMAGDVAVVYGGAGCGKTVAARRYAAEHPNVWVATMTASTRAWGPCLARVALACGLRSRQALAWRLEAELLEKLAGTRGLLLVDEAQHLELRALEGLRGLHDAAGVGLALVGNEMVYARLTGGRRAADFAQLYSRIGKRVRLVRPTQADVARLLSAWKVRGTAEREELLGIARSPGGLRSVVKCLRLASLIAEGSRVRVSHIRAAWRDLGGV